MKEERMEWGILRWDPITKEWVKDWTLARVDRPPNPKKRRSRRQGKSRIAQVNRLAFRDGLRCYWCTRRLFITGGEPSLRATIDHYPVSKAAGGHNGDDNAVLACPACNQDRAAGKKGAERIRRRREWVIRNGLSMLS